MLELRGYQTDSLNSLERYLRKVAKLRDPKLAFMHLTERPYRSVAQLPGLPYVCLRVPTGGGKTLMACHALGIAAAEYLQTERTVCLWLVPSNTIRDQTLAALRDHRHPYREAVAARFGGQVTVSDLAEALYVQRATLDGETTIIVATLAALRVEDMDGRKVYETNGQLMHHFTGLSAELEAQLETQPDGTYPRSLCNVLRLRRPVVIMDEAHNSRTPLSFDTLARFSPSCILEFTATPQLDHHPDRGEFASNVLHHVSAAELKAADMVKLPIKLSIRTEWKEAVGLARQLQHDLEQAALAEERQSGEYIRPIVLLQAQPRSATRETLTVEIVKQCLLDDCRVPAEEIAVATGDTRQIDDVDLFDRGCPIRFIITVAALKEGWDCSFAYVFCSVADVHAARAVEQLLGRVLRMPKAKRKQHGELNCAYAVVASNKFLETANSLKDKLVENGFERIEAEWLIRPSESQGTFFGAGALFPEVAQQVAEAPDLSRLGADLRERVTFDPATSILTVRTILDERQRDALAGCFTTPAGREAVEIIYRQAQGLPAASAPPTEPRGTIRVPQLAIRIAGQLEIFEEDHFRDAPWDLANCDAALSEADFPSTVVEGTSGQLDVSEAGRVEIQFVEQLQRQLHLIGIEPGWDVAGLTNWIDRQIHHPDLTQTQATLFIHRVLEGLCESRRLSIEQLARQKYPLRTAIAERIDHERQKFRADAFNRLLFSQDAAEIEASPELYLELTEDRYAPNWYYEGSYRFERHLFRPIGELKSEGEEFDYATFLDQRPEVKWWVRNLSRGDSSFWLQTATDKTYPDFIVLLNDGRILVVEYKSAHDWSNDDSREKRAIGNLWADRSNGKCLFVMPKGTDRSDILAAIANRR